MPSGRKGDKLEPMSIAWRQRQLVHDHNGMNGSVAFAKQAMRRILDAQSTTPDAKSVAMNILGNLEWLQGLLKDRVNLDGTTVHVIGKAEREREALKDKFKDEFNKPYDPIPF